MRTLTRTIVFLFCMAACFPVWAEDSAETTTPDVLKVGKPLPPGIVLPLPAEKADKDYLGLEKVTDNPFPISRMEAEVLIIQIFSMYCPHCQREAPTVNALFSKLAENPEVKNRVKLIGIGAGNSEFEVAFYKKKYDVRFPLFQDGVFSVHKMIGEVRTPYFIGVKKEKDGTARIFYSHLGSIGEPTAFIETILKSSGLKK